MNRFASTLAATALLLSAISLTPATAAEPATPAAVQAAVPITAPAAVLSFDRVTVTTVAAPVVVKVPVKAAAKAAVKVPRKAVTQPLVIAPAPVVVPAPAVDPYSGNPIVDCAALGLVTAEDFSCVSPTFYAPETGTDAPFVPQPCDDEDDQVLVKGVAVDSCYWHAPTRGNGTGQSFTKSTGSGIVYDRK